MSGKARAKRPWWRRILRTLGLTLVWTPIVGVIVVLATLQVLRLPAGQERLRGLILDNTKKSLPGLSLARIEGDYTSWLSIRGLVLDDRFGGPAIRADQILVRYDLTALLSHTLRVRELRLVRPHVTVRKTKTGAINLAELVTPSDEPPDPPSSEPLAWKLELDSLKIVDGGTVVTLDPKAPLTTTGLNLWLQGKGQEGAAALDLKELKGKTKLPDGKKLDTMLSARVSMDRGKLGAKLNLKVRGLLPAGMAELEAKVGGSMADLTAGVKLALPGEGLTTISARVQLPPGGKMKYEAKVRLERIQLRKLLASLPPAAINLSVEAAGSGVPLEAGSEGAVTIRSLKAPSAYEGIKLAMLHVDAGLKGKAWRLKRLALRAGGVRLGGSGKGSLDKIDSAHVQLQIPRLDRLPRLVTSKINIPDLGGAVRLDASVSGKLTKPSLKVSAVLSLQDVTALGNRLDQLRLTATAAGVPSKPRGSVKIVADGITPKDARLAVKELAVHASGNPGRVELHTARIRLLGGTLTASGVARPAAHPRLKVKLGLARLRPPGFPRRVSGKVRATVGRRAIDAAVDLELPEDRTRVSLTARVPVRYARGKVPPALVMTRPAALSLQVRRAALSLVNRLVKKTPKLGGAIDVDVDMSGPLLAPVGKAAVKLTDGRVDDLRAIDHWTELTLGEAATTLKARLSLSGRRLLTFENSVSMGTRLLVKTARAPPRGKAQLMRVLEKLQQKLELTVPATSLPWLTKLPGVADKAPALAKTKGSASVKVTVNGAALQPRARVEIRLKGIRQGDRRLGDVKADLTASVTPGRTGWALALSHNRRPLVNAHGHAGLDLKQLMRSGKLPRAPLTGEISIPSYPLAALHRLDQQLEGSRGTLSGTVSLSGVTTAPDVRASVRLHGVSMGKIPVGDLTADASLINRLVEARVKLRHEGGGVLDAAVKTSLLPKAKINGKVIARDVNLAILKKLTPAIRNSAGRLQMQMDISGKQARPKVAGHVKLKRGLLHLRGISPLKELALLVELDPSKVNLKYLRASSGDGTLRSTGKVALRDLKPTRFSLTTELKKFRLDAGGIKNAILNGKISVEGKMTPTLLTTRVALDEVAIKMPKFESQRKLHETGELKDVVFVDKEAIRQRAKDREVSESAKPPLPVRVTVRADPIFARGDDLDVEIWTKGIAARTDDKGRMRVHGRVGIRRGKIKLLGNDYDVRRAIVSLSGEVDPDPSINITLARQIEDVTVLIELSGTARAPKLALRCEPPTYTRAQIMSLILTGRVEIREDSGDSDSTMAVANAVSGALLGGLASKFAPKVGIDVTKVNLGETTDEKTGEKSFRAEAEVGKYITDSLYLGYRRVFGAAEDENANEGRMEYRISSQWLLMALFGDAGVGSLDVIWTYRY